MPSPDGTEATARSDSARAVETASGRTSNDFGLWEDLVVHGRARIEEGGAPELLQQLAYTYLAPA